MKTLIRLAWAICVIPGLGGLGACSLTHPAQYDFACSQGDGGTVPALIKAIPELLPRYHYEDFQDSCGDGSGYTLVFSSADSRPTDAQKILARIACRREADPQGLSFVCDLGGNRVEMELEDQRLYAIALPPVS